MQNQRIPNYHTQNQSKFQLQLDLNLTTYIKTNDSVRLLSNLLEGLDYTHLLNSYSDLGRNSAVPPIILFKIILYAYMNRIYSSRDIMKACQRDIHFLWLLNGYPAPSHNAINRFRKKRLRGHVLENLFTQFIQILHKVDEIQFENIFIDGTKLEANANRYSFIWLRAVTKNEEKLHEKIKKLFREINQRFDTNYYFDKQNPLLDLEVCAYDLEMRAQEQQIVFVSGKGSRKSEIQRLLEHCQTYIDKQRQYLDYQQRIGTARTSCSKTDVDATFMRMKEDHMKNGQLKPAYNLQIGVEAEYIVGAAVYQKATDTPTLIPFIQQLEANYCEKFKNVIADAGYESEENYQFLEQHGYTTYIKPINYEQVKKRNFQKQIGRRENMEYDAENDRYCCRNNQWLIRVGERTRKAKNGHSSQVTIYESYSCEGCPFRSECTKSAVSNKRIEVSKQFITAREQSVANIQTPKGIVLRKNRSIQVEGAFGVLKQDYGFRRFFTRGKVGVTTEFLLLCFGYNVNKLHNKIQSGRLRQHLHSEKVA